MTSGPGPPLNYTCLVARPLVKRLHSAVEEESGGGAAGTGSWFQLQSPVWGPQSLPDSLSRFCRLCDSLAFATSMTDALKALSYINDQFNQLHPRIQSSSETLSVNTRDLTQADGPKRFSVFDCNKEFWEHGTAADDIVRKCLGRDLHKTHNCSFWSWTTIIGEHFLSE